MYGETYGAEGLQEPFTPVQSYHGAPLTGQYDTRIWNMINFIFKHKI